jgi:hypothetical protein
MSAVAKWETFMKLSLRYFLVLAALVLSGCASVPQGPLPLQTSALSAQSGQIGVMMTPIPKPEVSLPGAGCVLCVVVAAAANSSLSRHAETLPVEDIPKLGDQVADAIRKRGANAIVLKDVPDITKLEGMRSDVPNMARDDFRPLKDRLKVERLVVIQLDLVGFERSYSAYVPTSDPKAAFRGRAFMVNLSTNMLEWFLPVNILKSADGRWDEPTAFPGLTNAYFQALELGRDQILQGAMK